MMLLPLLLAAPLQAAPAQDPRDLTSRFEVE